MVAAMKSSRANQSASSERPVVGRPERTGTVALVARVPPGVRRTYEAVAAQANISLEALQTFALYSFLGKFQGVPPNERPDVFRQIVEEFGGRTGRSSFVDAIKRPDYTKGIMDKAAKACKPAADFYGLPIEDVKTALENLAAEAARETTGRAKEQPRAEAGVDLKLSPSQVVAVIEDSTLGRLRRRYAALLEANSNLPDKLNEEQARAATKLSMTYRTLQARLRKVGLPPIEPDVRVAEANRRSVAFYRSRKPKVAAASL
jgi:hypothetical protein